MDGPIVNPKIPFVGPIPGGLQRGKMVRIQGIAALNGDRFDINLQTGPNLQPRNDTALHMSVRLNQGYIARNSYLNGEWGDEQGDEAMPIGQGQQFEIIILCDSRDFKIAVNGQHFCEFPQRLDIDSVSHLLINGDVTITIISWEGNVPSAPMDAGERSSSFSPTHSAGFGGPSQGYGALPPQGYGPPPPQGYGAGGYGPPRPPGREDDSGIGGFFDQAQSVLMGAIASGLANKMIGGLMHPNEDNRGYSPHNARYGEYPHPPGSQQGQGGVFENLLGNILGGPGSHSQQRQSQQPQFGGDSGGLGGFLSSLAGEVLNPDSGRRHHY